VSTVVEVLRRGRELYASAPSHAADPGIPERGTYCPLTATLKACGDAFPSWDWMVAQEAMNAADVELRRAAGSWRLVSWNAENSTETVLEAWDRAIAIAEAKT
jgi:hypothetical protein